MLLYTVGVYYLSKSDDGSGRASAAEQVFTLPVTYAVVAAGVVLAFDLVPPTSSPAVKSIKLLGDASIPLFLIILGLQVAEMRPGQTVRRYVGTVVLLTIFGALPVVTGLIFLFEVRI